MSYHPTSRRPISDLFRKTAHGAVRLCIKLHIHPDAISYASVVAAAGAAVCFYYSFVHLKLLAPAALLCILRLYFNMLDGMVALAANKASLRGEIVNELPDRISDILIFTGLAHSGWLAPPLAYWAAILALLTAYVGTLGQAVAGKRRFEGLMSKQWRMLTLALAAAATLALHLLKRPTQYLNLSLLAWSQILIIGGCTQTILLRLANTLNDLRDRAAPK